MKQRRNSTDLHGKLKTTIVDSFPLDKTQANMERILNDQISLGIESGDPVVQKKIKKRLNLEKVKKAINLLTKYDIILNGFFMLGFLNETKKQMEKTVKFIKDSKLHFATIHKVSPFPGTELYNEVQKFKGLSLSISDINEDEYRFGKINISNIDIKELNKLQKNTYYESINKKYIKDYLNFYDKLSREYDI